MTDLATYFRVVASILPKDVLLSVVDNTTMGGLSAEDRAALRRLLDAIQVADSAGGPAEVSERIEQILRELTRTSTASANGTFRTWRDVRFESAFGCTAEVAFQGRHFR
jgi:hypothetical protein